MTSTEKFLVMLPNSPTRAQLVGMVAALRGELYTYISTLEEVTEGHGFVPEAQIKYLYRLAEDTEIYYGSDLLVDDEDGLVYFDVSWRNDQDKD